MPDSKDIVPDPTLVHDFRLQAYRRRMACNLYFKIGDKQLEIVGVRPTTNLYGCRLIGWTARPIRLNRSEFQPLVENLQSRLYPKLFEEAHARLPLEVLAAKEAAEREERERQELEAAAAAEAERVRAEEIAAMRLKHARNFRVENGLVLWEYPTGVRGSLLTYKVTFHNDHPGRTVETDLFPRKNLSNPKWAGLKADLEERLTPESVVTLREEERERWVQKRRWLIHDVRHKMVGMIEPYGNNFRAPERREVEAFVDRYTDSDILRLILELKKLDVSEVEVRDMWQNGWRLPETKIGGA